MILLPMVDIMVYFRILVNKKKKLDPIWFFVFPVTFCDFVLITNFQNSPIDFVSNERETKKIK